jgi:hypothetical protein
LVAVVLVGLASAGSSVAIAADWSVEPKVALSAVYDDNHRLTEPPVDPVEVAGAALDALVVLGVDTPRTSFDFVPRFQTDFFPDDSEEETESISLRLDLDHRTEKASLGVAANYYDEDLLWGFLPVARASDELGNPVLGEDIDSSSVVNERQRFDIRPEFSYAVTPRWAVDLAMEYIDVDYSKTVEDESVPYQYFNTSAGLRYRLSDTSDVTIRGGFGRYEPEGDVDTNGYGVNAEWSRRASETSEVYLRGGFNRVEIADSAGDLDWESGFSGGGGVRWQFEVTSILVDATHYLDPNSTGSVVTRDQLQFWLSRRFAPMFSMHIGARGIQDRAVGDASEFRDRKYATGTLGLDWRFTRQFSLVAGYTYVWREYEDRPSAADSNALRLGVVYEPKRQ